MPDLSPILIIGAGNEYRSDDSIGVKIAGEFRKSNIEDIEVVQGLSDSTALLDLWEGANTVILIDAICSDGIPGTIYRLEPLIEEIPFRLFINLSTHAFNLMETIKLGRNLDQLPLSLIVYGIEGKNFMPGTTLSPEVRNAGKKVFELIKGELQKRDGIICQPISNVD